MKTINPVDSETILETKRGGYAVAFIYAGVFLIAVLLTRVLNVSNPYFFMGVAVVSVFTGYYFTPFIFNKPVITANSKNLWTSKLNDVPWAMVKDIYIERIPKLTTKGLGGDDVYLVIDTTDGRSESFDLMYLAAGENFGHELIKYWKLNSSHIVVG